MQQDGLWKTNYGNIRIPGKVKSGKLYDLRVETAEVRGVLPEYHNFKHDGYYYVSAVNEQTRQLELQFLGKTISDIYKIDKDNP